jgi:hypothetical protein
MEARGSFDGINKIYRIEGRGIGLEEQEGQGGER